MDTFKKNPLLVLFSLGLLLRLSLLFVDYSWDINNHITWAKDLWSRGFMGFYDTRSSEVFATPFPNYPPLALFMFYLVYPIQDIIYRLLWFFNITIPLFPSKLIFFVQNRAFLAAIFKLPAVFADLGLVWLIYLTAKKIIPTKKNLHLFVVSGILFNPAFFENSALWGQIDVIPLLFALSAFYFLFFTNRYITSSAFFVFGILIKPTILVVLPLYGIFFVRKYKLSQLATALFVSGFIFLIFFVPFIGLSANPFMVYLKKILATQSLPFVTNGAFNFWVIAVYFEGIKDTATFLAGLSYQAWGYMITGIFYVIILYYALKTKKQFSNLFYALFLVAFACFLFLTKMHERYSILPLPFLAIASLKEKSLWRWFVVLSLISFLNLYHSWPVPRVELVIKPLYHPVFVTLLSFFQVLIFFYLLNKYTRQTTS